MKFNRSKDTTIEKMKNYPSFLEGRLMNAIEFIDSKHNMNKSAYIYADIFIRNDLSKKYTTGTHSFVDKFVGLNRDYTVQMFEIYIMKL